MAEPLPRGFFDRPTLEVAPDLLNKVLVHGERSGRIVEVEAYLGTDDEASHSRNGPTPRTAPMFGPPGHLYVYLIYGVHHCANVVTEPAGVGAAVLIRALAPISGVDAMYGDRPTARRERDLCNGPGKLTRALGIDGGHDGLDLSAGPVFVVDDDLGVPDDIRRSPRIGITRSVDLPYRYTVAGDPNLSRRS